MKAPRITKEEVKAKLDGREPVTLLDVRNPVDYGNSNEAPRRGEDAA